MSVTPDSAILSAILISRFLVLSVTVSYSAFNATMVASYSACSCVTRLISTFMSSIPCLSYSVSTFLLKAFDFLLALFLATVKFSSALATSSSFLLSLVWIFSLYFSDKSRPNDWCMTPIRKYSYSISLSTSRIAAYSKLIILSSSALSIWVSSLNFCSVHYASASVAISFYSSNPWLNHSITTSAYLLKRSSSSVPLASSAFFCSAATSSLKLLTN